MSEHKMTWSPAAASIVSGCPKSRQWSSQESDSSSLPLLSNRGKVRSPSVDSTLTSGGLLRHRPPRLLASAAFSHKNTHNSLMFQKVRTGFDFFVWDTCSSPNLWSYSHKVPYFPITWGSILSNIVYIFIGHFYHQPLSSCAVQGSNKFKIEPFFKTGFLGKQPKIWTWASICKSDDGWWVRNCLRVMCTKGKWLHSTQRLDKQNKRCWIMCSSSVCPFHRKMFAMYKKKSRKKLDLPGPLSTAVMLLINLFQ